MGDGELCPVGGMGSCVLSEGWGSCVLGGGWGSCVLGGRWGSCAMGGDRGAVSWVGDGELCPGWEMGSCVLGQGAFSAGSKASLAVPPEPRVFVCEEGRLSDERPVSH